MHFIEICSYDNYLYANMQMGFLQEQGINCHLKDEHTVTVDPFLSPALGGMKLMVAAPQAERALQLLNAAEKAYLATIPCPRCGNLTLEKITEQKTFPGRWARLKSLLINGQETEERIYFTCAHCHALFNNIPTEPA